jgi:GDPmannose 4,6-dehydratase
VFGALALDWKRHVEIDSRYFRPAEVDHLEGDASKAERVLGWRARTSIRALTTMMVESDLHLAEKELVLREAGHAEAPRLGYR